MLPHTVAAAPTTRLSHHRAHTAFVALAVALCAVAATLLGPSTQAHASTKGEQALAWAATKIGIPYVWGGEDDSGYDCSGLVYRAYQSVGIALAHQSAVQYQETKDHQVSLDTLQPGDLMFYGAGASSIHHVGIFAYYKDGEPWMLDAQQTGVPVGYHHGYSDFYAATRPAGNDSAPPPPVAPTINAGTTVPDNQMTTLSGTASPSSDVSVWSTPISTGRTDLLATVRSDSAGNWSYSVVLHRSRLFSVRSNGLDSPTVTVTVIVRPVINAPVRAAERATMYVWGHATEYSDVTIYGAAPGGIWAVAGRVTARQTGNWTLALVPTGTRRYYAVADGLQSGTVQTTILRYPTMTAPRAVAVGTGTSLSGTATPLSRVTVYFKRIGPYGVANTATADAAGRWTMGAAQRGGVYAYAECWGLKSPVTTIHYVYPPTVSAPTTIRAAGRTTLTGTGPAGWAVAVYGAPVGSSSFTTLGSIKADNTAHWTLAYDQTTSMQVYVVSLGLRSATATTKIVPDRQTTISAPARIAAQLPITIRGTAIKRATMTLYVAPVGSPFRAVGKTKAGSTGAWSYRITLGGSRRIYAVAHAKASRVVTTTVVRRPTIIAPAKVADHTTTTISGTAGAGSSVRVSVATAVAGYHSLSTVKAGADGRWRVRTSQDRTSWFRASADGVTTRPVATTVRWHPTTKTPASVPPMTSYKVTGHAGRGSTLSLYAKGSAAKTFTKVAMTAADGIGNFSFTRTAKDDFSYQVHGDYVGATVRTRVGVTAKVPARVSKKGTTPVPVRVTGTARPGVAVTVAGRYAWGEKGWHNGCNTTAASSTGRWACTARASRDIGWRVGTTNGAMVTPRGTLVR